MQRTDITQYPMVTIQPYIRNADSDSDACTTDYYYVKEEIIGIYTTRDGTKTYHITIPKGYIFDGASIPKIFWSLIGVTPFSSKVVSGAAFHDMCYNPLAMTRKEADQMIIDICKAHGLGSVKQGLIRMGLFLGGWVSYYFTGSFSSAKLKDLTLDQRRKITDFVKKG